MVAVYWQIEWWKVVGILFSIATVKCDLGEIPLPIEQGSLINIDLGLPKLGTVICFGHFTDSHSLDVVVMDETRTQAFIYAMDHSLKRYKKTKAIATSSVGSEILNAILQDFNLDGWADLLLMTRKNNSKTVDYKLFLGNGEILSDSLWKIAPSEGVLNPISYKGNRMVDLFGLSNGKVSIWQGVSDKNSFRQKGWESPIALDQFKSYSDPNWFTQSDFNGDGYADLLLTTSKNSAKVPDSFEIWTRSKENFKLSVQFSLPPGSGPLHVADIDGDGNQDIIFAVCHPKDSCKIENSLHILYNTQPPFCHYDGANSNCKSTKNLFSEISDENFDFETMVIDLTKILPSGYKILFLDDLNNDIPIPMSIGDYDLDSFPDIAITISQTSNIKTSHPALLHNIPCDSKTCSESQISKSQRTFQFVSKQIEEMTKIKGSSSVSFADWFGQGPAGFLVNFYDSSGSPGIACFLNSISQDSFFLRAESVSDLLAAGKQKKHSKATYSPALSTFKFLFIDQFGMHQVRGATQSSQVFPRALQSPIVLFGLGRTSNFLQSFNSASSPSLPKFEKQNIFPNSHIILKPGDPWTAELEIYPGDHVMYVLVSVVGSLVILALITGWFKWKERKEDELERKQQTHLINFDAL